MTNKNYKYKFSVIIPIYNVEDYIAETLESVINQTIGFKDNIQIILVNDGSPDNSEKICKRYVKKYPNNIIYVYQDNAGVSAARNKGIKYIEGKYVNFLDSDDIWQNDVFEKAYNMFETNEDIDMIGVRQKYFEAANGYPSLDYKFDSDKIVDLNVNYDHIQLSVTSGFFRTSAIGKVRYDTRVKYSEDAKFINEIILQKLKLGIISSSLHLYRKRASENSAIQTKNFKDDWYLITPTLCYQHAIDLSKEKFGGVVIPYVQFYIAYDYQWRLMEPIPSNVSNQTIEKYLEITRELFNQLDDKKIFAQKRISADLKIEYLKFKYGEDVCKKFEYKKERNSIYYKKLYAFNLERNKILSLNVINVYKNFINLKGLVNINLPNDIFHIDLVINKKQRIKLDLQDTNLKERKTFNYVYMTAKGFDVNIDLTNLKSFHFEFVFKNKNRLILEYNDAVCTRISPRTKIYYRKHKKIFYYIDKQIRVKNDTLKNRIRFALRNTKFNFKNKEYEVIRDRIIYAILKFIKRKEIWIISDRPNTANDNGFALFQYLQDNMPKNVNAYFVINKNCSDYNKVKKTGKILEYNSWKYKMYFLLAKKIISSQADNWVTNPFGTRARFYQDLMDNQFYFLQHGIIKDDLSTWLNKYEKNLYMFVTSARTEYNSIIKGQYGFNESVVKLTGLPRYDLLKNNPKKTIVIMPTWRTNLSTNIDSRSGRSKYNEKFKNSEYCNFYNKLINDDRILNALRKYNYKCLFVMHSRHEANLKDFKKNKIVKIISNGMNYTEIFNKSSLLITDFSSVAFDFAYLRKPVIYTQFDKDTFFENQIYKEGYFKYEKNGFGPVVYDYEKTVKMIIKYIENNCKIDNKYLKRIDKFYEFYDRDNCKRVLEEILK